MIIMHLIRFIQQHFSIRNIRIRKKRKLKLGSFFRFESIEYTTVFTRWLFCRFFVDSVLSDDLFLNVFDFRHKFLENHRIQSIK